MATVIKSEIKTNSKNKIKTGHVYFFFDDSTFFKINFKNNKKGFYMRVKINDSYKEDFEYPWLLNRESIALSHIAKSQSDEIVDWLEERLLINSSKRSAKVTTSGWTEVIEYKKSKVYQEEKLTANVVQNLTKEMLINTYKDNIKDYGQLWMDSLTEQKKKINWSRMLYMEAINIINSFPWDAFKEPRAIDRARIEESLHKIWKLIKTAVLLEVGTNFDMGANFLANIHAESGALGFKERDIIAETEVIISKSCIISNMENSDPEFIIVAEDVFDSFWSLVKTVFKNDINDLK